MTGSRGELFKGQAPLIISKHATLKRDTRFCFYLVS